MPNCPSCGNDNTDDARYCVFCGTGLTEGCANCGAALPGDAKYCPSCGAEVAPTMAEERRFLTVLFADLVGFTADSDEADPEDVRARLVPYHERLRREIERHAGTVEKLIGDGVMAVFGVPTAHEDDPERAVRAALRIQEAVGELNEERDDLDLIVRIGINTGETVVTHGGQGETIVGDVVNTASRLESIAPPGGVVVGETTHRATERVIDYEDMDTVEVKGKAKPLRVWRAVEPRSRYGIDTAVRSQTPFLGRESDLAMLEETYRRVVEDGTNRLVTIVAEPGVGKSRLVNEFWRWADDRPEMVWWRQGRCLPYGDGITFWALGEVVKGQAGIRDTDTANVATSKLATALEAITPDAGDREWLVAHLGSLVGAAGELKGSDRTEAFAAWRRFLQDLSAVRPLVMVVEDLHWADAALIDFLEDVLVWCADSPIMVICTARPELYEAHPTWGAGRLNSVTISLTPLTDDHISTLVASLLERAVLPAETLHSLLDRAGGNPLYAEEFVRMLSDRGMMTGRGSFTIGSDAVVAVPETIQALIGARLDVLSAAEAHVIEDAAVVGKVFWEGALEALGDSHDVRSALRSLVTREWIRPKRVSSVEGQQEYAFWHTLTRDVAYGRTPRAARARKHRTMAEWIESTTGERASDHAELLAHHLRLALEYAEASGEVTTASLKEDAIRSLTMAGERAQRLDVARARDYYQEALELMGEAHPGRADLLIRLGIAADEAGGGPSVELYEEAAKLAEAAGDRTTAGRALTRLHTARWFTAGTGAGTEDIERAVELLESGPPTPALADAYMTRSGDFLFRGLVEQQLQWAQKGIELAEQLELDAELMRGLEIRGMGRFHLGDVEAGMADLERSLRIAEEKSPSVMRLGTAHVNLADHTWFAVGPAAALKIYERGIDRIESRGGDTAWPKAETMWVKFDLGVWDELISTADALLERWSGQPSQFAPWAQSYQGAIHNWRGAVTRAVALQAEYLPALRDVGDLQLLGPALVFASRTELARKRRDEAQRLLTEYLEITEGKSPIYRAMYATDATRLLVAVGLVSEAEEMLAVMQTSNRRARIGADAAQAILAEAAGDTETALAGYREAARDWAEYGWVLEEALARWGEGRCAKKLGKTGPAEQAFAGARSLLMDLGATPDIDQIDEAAAP